MTRHRVPPSSIRVRRSTSARRAPTAAAPAAGAEVRESSSVRLSDEERKLLERLGALLAPRLPRAPGVAELVREGVLSLATWLTAAPRGPRVRYQRERELRRALRELINLRSALVPGVPEAL